MTVPVTGGSRSVDEETLHEFHLGFFGFIFTCNFIPVYFSPLPSSPCPLSHAPPLPPSFLFFLHPLSALLLFLLRSSLPRHPPAIWEASPGRHSRNTRAGCLAPRTRTCMRCTKVSCSRCVHAVPFPHVHRCLHPTQNPHPTHLKRNPYLPGPTTDGCSPKGAGGRAMPQPGPRAGAAGSPKAVLHSVPAKTYSSCPNHTDGPTTLLPRWKAFADVG